MVSSESAMVTASPPQLSRDSRVSGKSSSLPNAYVSYGDHASWNICRTRVRAHSQRSGASSDVEHRMVAFIQNSRGGVLCVVHSQFVQSPPKFCIVRLPPSVYVKTVDPIFSAETLLWHERFAFEHARTAADARSAALAKPVTLQPVPAVVRPCTLRSVVH